MVSIAIMAIRINRTNCHGIIQANVVNISGECIVINSKDLRKINILQAAIVVECHVSDLCIRSKVDRFKACCTGESIFSDNRIFTDGYRLEAMFKDIVEVLLIVLIKVFDLEHLVLVGGESKVLKGNIVTDRHSYQLQAFTECAFRNRHTIRNDHIGQSRMRERILAHFCLRGNRRMGADGSFKERIFTDFIQRAQINGGNILGRTEAIIPYLNYIG